MTDVMCYLPRKRVLRIKDIVRIISEETGIAEKDLLGNKKPKYISHARHKMFYECKRLLKLSANRIGQLLGFDHSAVMYGLFWHSKRNNLPQLTGFNGDKHKTASRSRYKKRVEVVVDEGDIAARKKMAANWYVRHGFNPDGSTLPE